jgi:hypothetical protein
MGSCRRDIRLVGRSAMRSRLPSEMTTMATLLLTPDCDRPFPSPFAANEVSTPPDRSWTWENLIYLGDFLWASNQRQVSLGGGEPTLHPECLDFILYLLQRGFEVTVFTDGVVSSPRLEEFRRHLTGAPPERLTWVCNLRDPVQTPISPEATQRLHRFLSVLGPWTQAGFTINRLDFTLDFLFDHLSRFGLQHHLRLGLAHPAADSLDRFRHADNVRRVVERLYCHRHLFEAYRVRPHLDCRFPICTFSDAELGWLHRLGGQGPYGCRPALVIGPDMRVSYCIPIANYQTKSLFEFDSMEDIGRHFGQLRDELKGESSGIGAECDGCLSRENGGCGGEDLCLIAGRCRGEASIRMAEGKDGISQDRLPG